MNTMKEKDLQGERCDFCEIGTLVARKVREIYRRDQDVVIIDNVPAYVCDHCGERYYLSEVNKRIRAITANREKIANTIFVPTAEYEKTTV